MNPLVLKFLIQLAVSLAIQVVGYMLMPKPKTEKPGEMKDLEVPTAESGRPIPVIFGDITIKSPNVLWYGQKATQTRSIDV